MSILLAFFNSTGGIASMLMFSQLIFTNIHKIAHISRYTLMQEINYTSLTSIIGAVLSYYSISYFSRKFVFGGGHLIMSILLFLSGYMIMAKQEDVVLIMICVFMVIF